MLRGVKGSSILENRTDISFHLQNKSAINEQLAFIDRLQKE
jgi:hypothetical protein